MLDILFEDNHLIAVNKTVHDLVQGDKTGDITLPDKIKAYLKEKYHKPGDVFLGVVHRLDRPVSGVVVFARTSKALSRMNEQFRNNTAKKTYWALVKNIPAKTEGTLVHYMRKNEKQNKSYCSDLEKPGTKRAELSYCLLAQSDRYALVEVQLKTGRHHQIRSQLATIGSPIKGDLKYGFPRSNDDGGISLHARELCFMHPVKKEPIRIIAPTPTNDNLWSAFKL